MTREVRRQRQRASIERAAAAGDLARASALLAEHLIDFPEDDGLLVLDERTTADGDASPDGSSEAGDQSALTASAKRAR